MKSLPVRLDPELYARLKEVAELQESTMVDIVRRALEAFLPALAEAQADAVERRLERLRTLAAERPDYIERSVREAAGAEAAHPDPLERDLVVLRRDAKTAAGGGEATGRVREAFGELG